MRNVKYQMSVPLKVKSKDELALESRVHVPPWHVEFDICRKDPLYFIKEMFESSRKKVPDGSSSGRVRRCIWFMMNGRGTEVEKRNQPC